jgi:hypothetical protein
MAEKIEISTKDALRSEGALDLLLRREDLPDIWLYRIGKLTREVKAVCDEYRAQIRPIQVRHAERHEDGTLKRPKDPETGEELTDQLKFTPEEFVALQEALDQAQSEPVSFHADLIPFSVLQVENGDGEKHVPPITDELKVPHRDADGEIEEGVYDIREVTIISGGQLITALMPLIEMDLEE